MTGGLSLSPAAGLVLLVVMVLAGRQFRETWKAQAPGWQARAWAYGVTAALCFAALAFIPLDI